MKHNFKHWVAMAAAIVGLSHAAVAQSTVSLPFTCDFETAADDSQWQYVNASTNKWTIGSAANNGGSRGLYVSDDNGTSNAYTINSTSWSWAYVDVTLTAGQYYIIYDWKAYGEGNYDYLRVMLAPSSYTFTTTGAPNASGSNITSTTTWRTATPPNWINLGKSGSKDYQNAVSSWQNFSSTFTVSEAQAGTYHLVFAWVNDNSTGTQPPAAIDNIQFGALTCPAVTALTADSIRSHHVGVSWTGGGSETQWSVYSNGQWVGNTSNTWYVFTGLDANTQYNFGVRALCSATDSAAMTTVSARTLVSCPAVTGLTTDSTRSDMAAFSWTSVGTESQWSIYRNNEYIATTTNRYYIATGLDANTQYTFGVRAACDETDSATLTTIGIRTQCGTTATPATWDFENETTNQAPSCWTTYSALVRSGSANANGTGTAHAGSRYLDFRGTTHNMAIFPPFDAEANNLQVNFWMRPEQNNDKCGRFSIGYLTDPSDTSTFVPVETHRYSELIVNNTSTYAYFEVTMPNAPAGARIAMLQDSCATNFYWYVDDISVDIIPTCFKVTGLTATTVADTSVTLAWDDEINAATTTYSVYQGSRLLASGLTTRTYTINGLSASTTYTFGVMSHCAADDASRMATLDVRTACGPMAIPATFTFEDDPASATPECWTNYGVGQVWVMNSSYNSHNSSQYLDFRQSTSTLVAGPMFAAELNTLQVRFWLRPEQFNNANNGSFQVGYVTSLTDAASFVPVEEITNYDAAFGGAYAEFTVELGTAPAGARLAFRATPSIANYFWYLDDITVEPLPTCPKVGALSIASESITDSSATAVWVDHVNQNVRYEVYLGDSLYATVADTFYAFTGLRANNPYTVSVRVKCSDDDFSRTATATFRTNCAPEQPLPYTDDFEGYDAQTLPFCWTRLHGYQGSSGGYIYPSVLTSDKHSGTKSLSLYYMYNSTNPPQPEFAITPVLDADPANLHVKFWLRLSSLLEGAVLQAGLIGDPADDATFEPMLTLRGSEVGNASAWREYEFYTDRTTLTEHARVAFRYTVTNNETFYIDDLVIEEAPACRVPLNPVASNISYSGATLGWTDNSSDSRYLVIYGTSADKALCDTAVATATHLDLENLNAGTPYFFWVATLCNGDTTDFSEAGTFITDQACYAPTNLRTDVVTLNSATLNWELESERGIAPTATRVALREGSTTILTDTVSTTHYIFSGLNPSTTYTVQLAALCGDAYATATLSFTTPGCGEAVGTGSTSQFAVFHTMYANCYTQTLYPASTVDHIDTIRGIKIYNNANANTHTVDIYMANTLLNNIDTNAYVDNIEFSQVATAYTFSTSTAGWKEITFDSPFINARGSNLVVAFHQHTTSRSSGAMWRVHTVPGSATVVWYGSNAIDLNTPATASSRARYDHAADIIFIGNCTEDSCRAPLAVIDQVSTTSVGLSWNPGNNEEEWTVEYRRADSTEWLTAGNSDMTGYTVSELLPATQYSFRVGALCGGDTLYSPELNTYTACADVVLPLREGFEEASASHFPDCWTAVRSYQQNANNRYPVIKDNDVNYVHDGHHSLYLYGSGSNPNLVALNKPLPVQADMLHAEFYAKPSSSSTVTTLEAGIMTDLNDPYSFIPVKNVPVGSGSLYYTEWNLVDFYTDGLQVDADEVYFAIRLSSTSGTNVGCYIDDIALSQASTCRRPVSGRVTRYNYEEASFSWVPDYYVAEQYAVRLTTTYDPNDENAIEEIFSGDTTGTIYGIQPATHYYAWVAARCDGEYSDFRLIDDFSSDSLCYTVLNPHVTNLGKNAASIEWEYNESHGLGATSVYVVLNNLNDSLAEPVTYSTPYTGLLLSGLEPGITYRADFYTLCGSDSSAATSVRFTTPTCAVAATDAMSSDQYAVLSQSNNARHSYTQNLYPASVLNGMDSITGISFRLYSGYDVSVPIDIDVYMANTALTTLTYTSFVPAEKLQKVATYHFAPEANGWMYIPFDTVFEHHGDSNIVVAVLNNSRMNTTGYVYWSVHTAEVGNYAYTTNTYASASYDIDINTFTRFNSYQSSHRVADAMFHGNCATQCEPPVLMAQEKGPDYLSFVWTLQEDAYEHFLVYRPAGGSWDTVTDIYTDSYMLDELTPSTVYEVKVGYICGEDTLFSQVVSNATLCLPVSVPFVDNFTTIPLSPCYVTSSNSQVYTMQLPNGDTVLHFQSTGDWVVLPEVDESLDLLQLRTRYVLGDAGYTMRVGITYDLGQNITWIDTLTRPDFDHRNDTLEHATYFRSFHTELGARIVLGTGYAHYPNVVSIAIESSETCFPVDNLKAYPAVGGTHLTWTYRDEVPEYEVQYKPTLDYEEEGYTSVICHQTDTVLRSLAPSTEYTFRVRAICDPEGGDTGRWSNIILTTPCEAATLPYSEDFNSYTGNSVLNQLTCWNFYEEPRFDNYQASDAEFKTMSNNTRWLGHNTAVFGDKHLALQVYGVDNVHHWAVTPFIEMTDSLALLNFDMAITLEYPDHPEQGPDADDRFIVAASTDDGITWQPLAMWGSDNARDTYSLAGQPTNTPIHVSLPVGQLYGTTARFAFYGQSTEVGSNILLHVDNIVIDRPVCPAPAISAAVATDSTITLTFTGADDSAQVFIIDHPMTDADPETVIPATSPYTFSGLEWGTAYTVGVRHVCGNDYYSEWVTRAVVTTTPACDQPGSLTVDSIGITEATAFWTASATAQRYDVCLAHGTDTVRYATIDTFYHFTGLTANESYSVSVRSVCDTARGLATEWMPFFSFTTSDVPVERYTLTATVNDATMGTVSGGGLYEAGTTATLVATAFDGFEFVAWNDGTTANPRYVQITSDTAFEATFRERQVAPQTFTVSVSVNDATMGTVTGAGTYDEGTVATLTALPNDGYEFVAWNDGTTANPRYVQVSSDTAFVAEFRKINGIDDVVLGTVALYPNPATSMVTVSLDGFSANGALLTLVDLNGRTILSRHMDGNTITLDLTGYAQGTYFVRLTTDEGCAVGKLIVK